MLNTLMKNTNMREIQSISSDLHFLIPSGFIHFKYAKKYLSKDALKLPEGKLGTASA